jgi:hypothetical protein
MNVTGLSVDEHNWVHSSLLPKRCYFSNFMNFSFRDWETWMPQQDIVWFMTPNDTESQIKGRQFSFRLFDSFGFSMLFKKSQ